MVQNGHKRAKLLLALSLALFILLSGCTIALAQDYIGELNGEINDLSGEIESKKSRSEELERRKKTYEENIRKRQSEIYTLNDEISYLDYRIDSTWEDVEGKQAEIQKHIREIDFLMGKIGEGEGQIARYKQRLGEFIRQMHQYDRKSYLEILLLNDSFSEFFDQVKYLEDFQSSLKQTLDEVKAEKAEMEDRQKELESKRDELKASKAYLEEKNLQLEMQKNVKSSLLSQTKGEEAKYRALVADIQREVREINAEVIKLEKEARRKLAELRAAQENGSDFGDSGKPPFSWPVPFKKITSSFHDPDYPYRHWIGEHSGTDLRAAQGTTLKAPASGYIAKTRNAGRWGYSYILLVHDDGFSTLYGHVSKISVEKGQYVKRGDVIGKTGGMPGTPGAGRYCTGPHLHFEVRKDSVPVDPMKYMVPWR